MHITVQCVQYSAVCTLQSSVYGTVQCVRYSTYLLLAASRDSVLDPLRKLPLEIRKMKKMKMKIVNIKSQEEVAKKQRSESEKIKKLLGKIRRQQTKREKNDILESEKLKNVREI